MIIMKKNVKRIIKSIFCTHEYQPKGYGSAVTEDGLHYNTDYYFQCRKCGANMTLRTYGEDDVLNDVVSVKKLDSGQVAKVKELIKCLKLKMMGSFSDGYHTFDELYHHRAVLFSVICNTHKDIAWKSKKHDTGDMYDGMFIVGIETPDGQATYHYDIEPYWDMFNVKELEFAPTWDGHTPGEAIRRIGLLTKE